MRAIIIDDEDRARRVLKSLLTEYCEDVEIIGECSNVLDGVEQIKTLNPDVVFCDIEMPKHSGLELLSFFNNVDFEIIFATGYSDYAIQAFEMSAIDYLLKPIQIDKLEIAIERVKQKLRQNNIQERLNVLLKNLNEKDLKKIALPVNDGFIFIDIDSISFLEADGSYTMVWLKNGKKHLVSKRLKTFEELLNSKSQFYRIHRSYLINIDTILKYSKSTSYITLENDKVVRISRDKKTSFENYISDIRL